MSEWPDQKVEARFWANVSPEPNSGCWLWSGDHVPDGYGRIMVNGRRMKAHRLAAAVFMELAADDPRIVCHRCDVPACVNPDHLFLGDQADNIADAVAKGRLRAPVAPSGIQRKTADARRACKRGHLWIAENITTRASGKRECRLCISQRDKDRYSRQGSRWSQRSDEWKQHRKEARRGK